MKWLILGCSVDCQFSPRVGCLWCEEFYNFEFFSPRFSEKARWYRASSFAKDVLSSQDGYVGRAHEA